MKKTRPSPLHPRQLEAVLAVGRAGSVHAAARDLGIPQPAVSRLVAATERSLGVSLFARSRTGTQLTETGERVLRQVGFALHALEGIAEAAKQPEAVLRVGCIPRVMHVWVPHVLAHIDAEHPDFRVHVSVLNSDELAQGLATSRLDYAVGLLGPVPSVESVVVEELYNEKTVVVCGRLNRAIPSSGCSLAQLAAMKWVLPRRGAFSRDLLDTLIAKAGFGAIMPVIESASFESTLSVVAGTRYIGIAPEFAARRFERLKMVRIVRTSPSLGSGPVMLQFRSAQRGHPAHAEFRAVAISAAREVRAL